MTKRKREDPTGIQFKSFKFDTKAVAAEPDADGMVYIEGYASVFDIIDSHNDMVVKGAYLDTLKEWEAKGVPIPSYYNHGAFSNDPMDNVGYLSVAQEDETGLKITMALDVGHNEKAAYAHRLVKQGRLREFSVGYIAKAWELIYEEGKHESECTRKLTAIDLLEVSLVSIASNPLATVTAKAAALLYGAADAVDDDPEDDDEPEAKELSDDAAAEAFAAIKAAREALDLAEAALAVADEDDPDEDPEEDPDGTQDDSGEPVGAKRLSARARVALAMTALHGAETE